MSSARLFARPDLPLWLLGGVLAALFGRLVFLHVFESERLAREVDRAVTRREPVVAPRGRILAATGEPLAESRATVHLSVDGAELRSIERRNALRNRKNAPFGVDLDAWLAEECLRLRSDLAWDLAAELRSTAGAPSGTQRDRAFDLAERMSRATVDEETGALHASRYVVIARDLDPMEEKGAREVLKRHRLSWAFTFEEDFDRVYPLGAAVSSVVGFLGARDQAKRPAADAAPAAPSSTAGAVPEPARVGRGGIEEAFEAALRACGGSEDILRAPAAAGGLLDLPTGVPALAGADVVLSIDPSVQSILHAQLVRTYEEFPSRGGLCGVILDARTGFVLALDSVPSFDPNARAGERNHPLANHAVVTPYEPGSAIKPFTVAAALEAGVIGEDTRIDVHHGVWQIPGRAKPIRDSHFDASANVQTPAEVIARSSNVGAVTIGQRLGPAALESAFRRYGFDERSGVEIPGEARSRLPRRQGNRPWDVPNTLSSVSFGYQFVVTPIRFAAAYGMLANGGLRVEPRLVREVRYPDGSIVRPALPEPERVLREDVARAVQRMCQDVVVETYGTAHRRAADLKRAGFLEVDLFGGKSGSAVIHKRPDRLNGTFACFGPMPDPRLVVLLVAFDPDNARFGGEVCARPALEILARALRAYGITPPSPRSVDLAMDGAPSVVEGPAPDSALSASRTPH